MTPPALHPAPSRAQPPRRLAAGHVLPGAVFVLWGAWWAYSAAVLHLRASARRPFAARAWYPFEWCGRALVLLEPALKVGAAAPACLKGLLLAWARCAAAGAGPQEVRLPAACPALLRCRYCCRCWRSASSSTLTTPAATGEP